MTPEEQRDYGYVMHSLRKLYGKHTKNRTQILDSINRTVFSNFKSLNAYATAKMRQLRFADITGGDAIMYFVNGLPVEWRRYVNLMNPKTFDEALDIAKRVERDAPPAGNLSSFHGNDNHRNDSRDSKRVQFRENSPHPSRTNYQYNSSGHQRQRSTSRDRQYTTRGRSPANDRRGRSPYDNRGRSPARNDRRTPSPGGYNAHQRRQRSSSNDRGSRTRSNSRNRDNSTGGKSFCKICNDFHSSGKHILPQCFKCKGYGHIQHECKSPNPLN